VFTNFSRGRRQQPPERKWIREVIKIDTDCGRVALPARVLGPIAVHFGVGSHAKKISITHIGTGRQIASTNAADAAQQLGEALAELNCSSAPRVNFALWVMAERFVTTCYGATSFFMKVLSRRGHATIVTGTLNKTIPTGLDTA
jgi:hypothetical protein